MAPDGGHIGKNQISTVITCEGTLGNPEFPLQFQKVLDRLNGLLGVSVKVRKLEPWNSVRVTLSVPREAALRLRQLAQQGAQQLRALGILSVQLDGEGAISLRIQNSSGEAQEVVLRTTQDGQIASSSGPLGIGSILPITNNNACDPSTTTESTASSVSTQVQFKSPNVVCPPDSVVPRMGTTTATPTPSPMAVVANSHNRPPFAGPFPFASMNQAIQSQSNSSSSGSTSNSARNSSMEPPPYPGVRQVSSGGTVQFQNQPTVNISSPLLVNLLQNDQPQSGNSGSSGVVVNSTNKLSDRSSPAVLNQTRPSPPSGQSSKMPGVLPSPTTLPTTSSSTSSSSVPSSKPHQAVKAGTGLPNHLINSQANALLNSSNNNIRSSSNISDTSSLSLSVTPSNALPKSNLSIPISSTESTTISNIANSLALSSSNIANGNSSATDGPLNGLFTQHGGAQQYQRTPQGSIIAVKKPVFRSNQLLGSPVQNAIPLHQLQPTGNMALVQTQSAQPLRLQQQAQMVTNVPSKTGNVFVQKRVAPSGNALLLQSQRKLGEPSDIIAGSNLLHNNLTPDRLARASREPQQQQGMVQGRLNTHLSLTQSNAIETQVSLAAEPTTSNIIKKPLSSPPPYNVAISRGWDALMTHHSSANLLDLAPSLTDLKPDELDELLPTLDHDSAFPELSELELLGSALHAAGDNLCEEKNLLNNGSSSLAVPAANGPNTSDVIRKTGMENLQTDGRKFLINPLTGELEPQSGGEESDTDEIKDVFTDLPSPLGLSDEDTNSTTRPDTATDQSDSETRSSTEGRHVKLKNSKLRKEGRDSPAQKEKIKLRLKIEKNEPINSAYKVDVSFINAQQPRKASTSTIVPAGVTSPGGGVGSEELRVPPLHISLRGRNSAVIKNKSRVNSDDSPMVKKAKKIQAKMKKDGNLEQDSGASMELGEHKKVKKFKPNPDPTDIFGTIKESSSFPADVANASRSIHNYYKEKQKERRGSDSELVRVNSKKQQDANGAIMRDDKKRRLSQSESDKNYDAHITSVVGSTNVGTVAGLPQKMRKDKFKLRDNFKIKENNRKIFVSKTGLVVNNPQSPTEAKKQHSISVALPTATNMDMEAKFKQSLMEGAAEKGIVRPPHRTVDVCHLQIEEEKAVREDSKVSKPLPDSSKSSDQLKGKSSSTEKYSSLDQDRKSVDSIQDSREKQVNNNSVGLSGGRSPNSGSGGQGEDSGIESMDALSEKSPNQASQSPHADIITNVMGASSKSQVPDMIDIEAQLAKMEGLESSHPDPKSRQTSASTTKNPLKPSLDHGTDDVNENECIHRNESKPCCDLTCTLEHVLDKDEVKNVPLLTKEITPVMKTVKNEEISKNPPNNVSITTTTTTTAVSTSDMYSYSSSPIDKGGGGSVSQGESGVVKHTDNERRNTESPMLTSEEDEEEEEEEESCAGALETDVRQHQTNNKNKSLLEQLLIEIPSEHHGSSITPNSHSPATRSSVRTRALSKLNSPELNSPLSAARAVNKNAPLATAKRKRNESDSSSHSVEEIRKRSRKGADSAEGGKKTLQSTGHASSKKTLKTVIQQQQDESSDSDEPLIEKLRKNVPKNNIKLGKTSSLQGITQVTTVNNQINSKSNIRRSARAGQQEKEKLAQPAQNTRSREKVSVAQQQQHLNHHTLQVQPGSAETEALRRKTRSTDIESKRKKEVK